MRSMKPWAIASSTTAIATSSRSARLRSGRIRAFSSEVEAGSRQENASNQESRASFRFYRNGTLEPAEFRKSLRHRSIHIAPERHQGSGARSEPLPSPLVEFRRLAVARRQWIDFIVGPGKAQREPFLPLAA